MYEKLFYIEFVKNMQLEHLYLLYNNGIELETAYRFVENDFYIY